MSRLQIRVVVVCLLLNMADGFDVLVMSFAAPAVADDWGLSGGEIGLLLSAGLVGMAAGSLFLAPVADRLGRRPVLVWSAVLVTVGLALSALAGDYTQLALLRVVTGLGIGAMLPSLTVLVAEYAPPHRRTAVIGWLSVGYPIGGTVGGALAALVIAGYGWRAAFVLGAVLTAILVLLVVVSVPESMAFLARRGTAAARERLERLRARVNLPEAESSETAQGTSTRMSWRPLFRDGGAVRTIALCVAFAFLMAGFYFVNTWTPRLLQTSGLSTQQGISGGILINLGGILGCVLVALLGMRLAPRPLAVGSALLGAAALTAFGLWASSLESALVLAVVLGIALNAGVVGLYALIPGEFPAEVRTTAAGLGIGLGRVGAIVAPLVTGALVDGGWPIPTIYFLFAVPVLLAAVAAGLVRRRPAAVTTGAQTPAGSATAN